MRWPTTSPRYDSFTLVYLRANPDICGTVTGYLLRANCPAQYLVTWGGDMGETSHWEQELTDEKQYSGNGESGGS